MSRPHDLDQRVTGYGTYGLLSVPMVSPLDGCFQAIMSGEWIRLRGGLGINFPSPFAISVFEDLMFGE